MQRRQFLSLFAGAVFPSELRRYSDPATELEVVRLTAPEYSSSLPRHGASRRSNFLLYAADRSGSMQVFRLDFRTGESRQLTDALALDPATLYLLPDEKGFLFCDGDLLRLGLLGGRVRDIAPATGRVGALSVSEDSQYCAFVTDGRLQLASLGPKPTVKTLAETSAPLLLARIRPRRTQVLYLRGDGSPWLVNFNG